MVKSAKLTKIKSSTCTEVSFKNPLLITEKNSPKSFKIELTTLIYALLE